MCWNVLSFEFFVEVRLRLVLSVWWILTIVHGSFLNDYVEVGAVILVLVGLVLVSIDDSIEGS